MFHLHVHFQANQSHFYLNGLARRLALKLRRKTSQKWLIGSFVSVRPIRVVLEWFTGRTVGEVHIISETNDLDTRCTTHSTRIGDESSC